MSEAVIKGFGLGLILALSVGPVIFTILKQSINNGHKGGFSFVAGVWLSDLFLVVLSNTFTELVKELLAFKALIGYIGSAFLIAMGVYFIFFKKVNLKTDEGGNLIKFSRSDFAKVFLSGFFINSLNPSVMVFWLINATAFAATHSFWQRLIVFSVCLGLNIIADILKVLMAGKIRQKLTPHNISIINKISGTILVAFGIALLYGVVFLKDKVNA